MIGQQTVRFKTTPRRAKAARWGQLLTMLCVAALNVSFTSGELWARRHSQGPALTTLHRITLTLDRTAIESLDTDPRRYVRATCEWEGRPTAIVRVHLKGRSSFQPIGEKPSLTVRFADGQKFHLNNAAEDPSFLNELLGTELFRAAGVPAPDVNYALLELNGRKLGLYVLKNGFSPSFLERAFPGSSGRIYDPVQCARETAEVERCPDRVEKEMFRSFVAMELLLVHRDGYALAENNFRLYADANRVFFLPTGMDQLFGKADYSIDPNFRGELARTIFANRAERESLRLRMRELLPLVAPATLHPRVEAVLAQLKAQLGRREFNELRTAADDLKERIARRHDFLQRTIDSSPDQPVLVAGAETDLRR